MFKTIEWLYLILLLFIINKHCMCWKNNPQVDFFFLFCCFMNQLYTKIYKDYLISTCLLCFCCCCFCSFACFFYCLMGMFLSSFGLELDRITFPVINKYCTKDLQPSALLQVKQYVSHIWWVYLEMLVLQLTG